VLWSTELPAGSEGIPATYEVDGRQYLVVPAGSAGLFPPRVQPAAELERAYVAFALPAR
jgi:quinoprotein glucose dehydrogenase